MSTILPENYQDICPSLREELEHSFGVYFAEELIDMFLRGVYHEDDVALEECENEVEEYVREFLYERLKDHC